MDEAPTVIPKDYLTYRLKGVKRLGMNVLDQEELAKGPSTYLLLNLVFLINQSLFRF